MAKTKYQVNIGEQYNDWIVIGDTYKNSNGYRYVPCKCKCGIKKGIPIDRLASLKAKHCNTGVCKVSVTTHGLSKHPLYAIWEKIKSRLKNPIGNNSCYQGITLCDEWLDFENFYNWALTNGWKEGLTIDRIQTNLGYSPDNCRWVDSVVQSQNRRKTKNNSTGYKGVYKNSRGKGYYTIIIYKGKRHQLWGFDTPEQAFKAREEFIKNHYDGLVYPE